GLADLVVGFEQVVVGHFAVFKVVRRAAVKQNDGPLRRLGAKRWALAFDLFELANGIAVLVLDGDDPVFHRGGPSFVSLDGNDAVFELAFAGLGDVPALPAIAR